VDPVTNAKKKVDIGGLIDAAMEAIEAANPATLKGVLPKDYGRPALDREMMGMQAIARVNRVFRDKPGGLIVDYIGILQNLKKRA